MLRRILKALINALSSAGIHPEFADTVNDETLAELEGLFKRPKVVALGEIGLDYYYDDVPRDVQREAFRRQLELAVSLDVPVIIHDREAHGDILSAVKAEAGVLHLIFRLGDLQKCTKALRGCGICSLRQDTRRNRLSVSCAGSQQREKKFVAFSAGYDKISCKSALNALR